MINTSGLATVSDTHKDLDERLLQILEQLSVKVWDKSKKAMDKTIFCQSTIEMIELLNITPSTIKEIVEFLKFYDSTELRRKILNPMISLGYVSMTNPDKPTSPKQKYTLTAKGYELFKH